MTKRDRRRRRRANLLPSAVWLPRTNLNRLQRQVWQAATEVPESRTAALAGSGGLAAYRILLRRPADIDLFVPADHELDGIWQDLPDALADKGFAVEVLRKERSRRHMMVFAADRATKVDLGVSLRVDPVVWTRKGRRVLSRHDLAAGKLMALQGRAMAKDFVDTGALTVEFSFAELCQIAAERQPRFNREKLASRLARFEATNNPED